jgi:hypothetical protein
MTTEGKNRIRLLIHRSYFLQVNKLMIHELRVVHFNRIDTCLKIFYFS